MISDRFTAALHAALPNEQGAIMAFDQKQTAKVVELYQMGLATSAIAERFGVQQAAVTKVLKSAGITLDAHRVRYDACEGQGRLRRSAHQRL